LHWYLNKRSTNYIINIHIFIFTFLNTISSFSFLKLKKIAVKNKSFIGDSPVTDLENALGQYILYYDILTRLETERRLYLAIRQETCSELFQEPIGKILLENQRLCLLI